MRLRREQENANEGALDLPVTELDGTSEQGGVRGMVSATALGGRRKLTATVVSEASLTGESTPHMKERISEMSD